MFDKKETVPAEMAKVAPDSEKEACDVQNEIAPDEDFSDVDEKKVLRKMDIRLIPMLALLYLLSFLDRGNIGNARLEGLEKDLNLKGSEYNWCLTVFFFTYATFEIPSNVLLKKLKPSIYLPSIMLAWGTVMTLMGIVQNYHGLLISRIFLGITEAGLYPGCAYYITMWYCSKEGQFRQALFFSAASMAGAFSGLLAYGIAKMDGVGGYAGWRWIFILEGLLTVVVAVMSFWTIYDFPDTAPFFTERERAFVVHRLKYQGTKPGAKRVAQADEFEWKYVWDAFKDWQVYVAIVMFWGIVCPLYGLSLFLPSIIRDLGYTASTAQLLTVPVYCTAAALAIATAWYADKKGSRSPFVLFYMGIIALGFIICIASAGRGVPGVVYAGVFIAVCGLYPAFPGNITWLSSNLAGSYKRATGMAIQIGIGNLCGAMAANFYRPGDAPKYYVGHSLELGFVVAGMLAALTLRICYQRINKKRDEEGTGDLTEEEMARMGDKSPAFRYSL
ncbi:hypothetical protein LOZ53_004503 [Ophidiomyces ophidiicola]|uniref:Uncharacterized protein n=1 Tax=Ophidiomyces ophidiicola TaxID=1387563 RepID=A0ACB8UZ73_9EURO|nr:uncharacterized protein LOZ57_004920 [Ophidiomyces ophidiicola]KAI1912113.1 hypothetical protein LOZ61_003463 [Ophidiomyces ophidiicola]KAI1921770.1 hypothetical protein LOZ64_001391 [Ophidiomyces ophidiicola]KAI1925400.1 hypothetical protein LOZ60_004205 [Ophidiomyces ophidiicola]KAI1944244.1 hypothetical protein LOZ57_004920 [Ophidiomyces ophidiicola]KAI1949344.1 hypothetical protein LOZ62_002308 [Ophidiomyces ophidiicola]